MNKDKIVIVILVAIVIGVIVLINFIQGNGSEEEEVVNCIAENSMLIVSKTCGHCVNQLRILGDNQDKFSILYVDDDPSILDEYDIRGVPSWIINEKVYSGVRSIEELKSLTGC